MYSKMNIVTSLQGNTLSQIQRVLCNGGEITKVSPQSFYCVDKFDNKQAFVST